MIYSELFLILFLSIFQDPHTFQPHCPAHEDECECSRVEDNWDISWCCRPPCYNTTAHPNGPNTCEDCFTYCDRTNTFHCCTIDCGDDPPYFC